MKTVIIGGVAGGATAAARLRRLDEKAQIVIYEKSGYISYANCGLPYYIGNVITKKDNLTLQTPDSFCRRFNVDVKVRHEVTAIDAASRTVTVSNLDTGESFTDGYDKLIIATGAKPLLTDLVPDGCGKTFTLRNVEDTERIHRFINDFSPKSAVVVGGGYVGLEMAENLKNLGMEITVIEYAPHLLSPFDGDMAAFVHGYLRGKGIRLMLGCEMTGIECPGEYVNVILKDGSAVSADMVILSAGVSPDTSLVKAAQAGGIQLGVKDSIAVNEHMQTSNEDIYAVGDAVEVTHLVCGKKTLVSLAGPANKQARIAADNICGIESAYKGALGSSVLKLFGMTAASTGINERTAKACGIDCESIILSPLSHASYYPDAKVMTMKVIFEKDTMRLLGAQIVGSEGVDKRIDILATAMQCGMSGDRLGSLELSYAPPFSSAKDPVNIAGYTMENIARGLVKQFHYDDVIRLQKDENVFLLDTRTPDEYSRGHADGFINIPVDALRAHIDEIPHDKPVYVMCQSGLRSYIACRILASHGIDCYNFAGGYRFYNTVKTELGASASAAPCGKET